MSDRLWSKAVQNSLMLFMGDHLVGRCILDLKAPLSNVSVHMTIVFRNNILNRIWVAYSIKSLYKNSLMVNIFSLF